MGQRYEFCGVGNDISRCGACFCSPRYRVSWRWRAKRIPERMTHDVRGILAVGNRPSQIDGAAAPGPSPSN